MTTPIFNTTSGTNDYEYSPLEADWFRLISVRRKKNARTKEDLDDRPSLDDFIFEIIVIDRQSTPRPAYETVSYVWGSSDRRFKLVLSDGRNLPVTASLRLGLPFWAMHCSTGHIWVDQICINQDDINERNQQVQRMGSIYGECLRVLCWLGDFCIDARLSKRLEEAEQNYDDAYERFCLTRDGDTLTWHNSTEKKRQMEDLYRGVSPFNIDLEKILCSSWFSRAWVFQEATLPPDAVLLCGPLGLDMILLGRVMGLLGHDMAGKALRTCIEDAVRAHAVIRLMAQRSCDLWTKQQQSVPAILAMYAILADDMEVSDRRDKVYAFIALFDEANLNVEVDYRLSAKDVFDRFWARVFDHTQSLNSITLSLSLRRNVRSDRLVAFWSKGIISDSCVSLPVFGACKRRLFKSSGDSDRTQIKASGRITGVVSDLLISRRRGGLYYESSFLWLQQLGANVMEKLGPSTLSHLLPVLLRSEDQNGCGVDQTTEAVLIKILEGTGNSLSLVERRSLRGLLDVVLPTGAIFSTADGTYGIAQLDVKENDRIAILHGLSVPLVLRPTEDGNYMIVSTAHIQGMMFGEACTWREDEADQFTLVWPDNPLQKIEQDAASNTGPRAEAGAANLHEN